MRLGKGSEFISIIVYHVTMIQYLMESATERLYEQLKQAIDLYGVKELLNLIVHEIPNRLIPHYITVLCILEWERPHPMAPSKDENYEDDLLKRITFALRKEGFQVEKE